MTSKMAEALLTYTAKILAVLGYDRAAERYAHMAYRSTPRGRVEAELAETLDMFIDEYIDDSNVTPELICTHWDRLMEPQLRWEKMGECGDGVEYFHSSGCDGDSHRTCKGHTDPVEVGVFVFEHPEHGRVAAGAKVDHGWFGGWNSGHPTSMVIML